MQQLRLIALVLFLLPAAVWSAPPRATVSERSFFDRLADAAVQRTEYQVRYDPAYRQIAYPGGDVPADTGVCSDEIVRSYRALGVDLQRLVHEDMAANFKAYPNPWRLPGPDANIDHRRVPNLIRFFTRKKALLPISDRADQYLPGDIVAWDLGYAVHIGIVTDRRAADSGNRLVMHNIGRGPELEDFLFREKIIAHARYQPA